MFSEYKISQNFIKRNEQIRPYPMAKENCLKNQDSSNEYKWNSAKYTRQYIISSRMLNNSINRYKTPCHNIAVVLISTHKTNSATHNLFAWQLIVVSLNTANRSTAQLRMEAFCFEISTIWLRKVHWMGNWVGSFN